MIRTLDSRHVFFILAGPSRECSFVAAHLVRVTSDFTTTANKIVASLTSDIDEDEFTRPGPCHPRSDPASSSRLAFRQPARPTSVRVRCLQTPPPTSLVYTGLRTHSCAQLHTPMSVCGLGGRGGAGGGPMAPYPTAASAYADRTHHAPGEPRDSHVCGLSGFAARIEQS